MMGTTLSRAILTRSWLRIGLAVTLLIVGLAPIGVPIVSDSSWRVPPLGAETATVEVSQPFMYRTSSGADGSTRVERSDDGAAAWHSVAAIPVPVSELVPVAGNEQVVYARGLDSIWLSEDAGATWTQTAALPSRPVVVAVTGERADAVFVGTESMGLLRSNNRGQTWQILESDAFAAAGAAPLSASALAIDPEDEQIVYAALGFWLGTSNARFNPLGVFSSVDGGAHWFEVSRAAVGAAPVQRIEPVPGRPLAATVVTSAGTSRVEMSLNETLLAALSDPEPGMRAAAARAIGLTGDRAAIPALSEALLRDTDILAGERIGEAIGRLGDRSTVPSLLEGVSSGNEFVQARSALALGMMKSDEAVPLLVQTLQTGMPMAQRRAAEALAVIGTPEAIAGLQTPLSNAEMSAARNAAMIGLELAGDRAVPSLAEALSAQDAALRSNAAEMLGWLKASQATPELGRALADTEAPVRAQAAWALGEIGTPEARQALAAALPSENNPAVREATTAAIARTAATTSSSPLLDASWGAGLLKVVATIPVSRWAFMILATALAVFLLMAGARQGQTRLT